VSLDEQRRFHPPHKPTKEREEIDMKLNSRIARAIRWPLVVAALTIATLALVPIAASGKTAAVRDLSGPKPTVVLVHGAWADGSSWEKVIPLLQDEGYTVDAPPNPLRGLSSDSAYLASYLSTIKGPIILVGHSYGGAVITNAAAGNSNVKGLVYVDAFQPAQGENLETLTFSKPGSCLAGGGNLANVFNEVVDPSQPAGDPDLYIRIAPGTDFSGFDSCFATDVPTKEANILGSVQRPLALDAFTQASGVPAWLTIPSWAVIGTQDQAIPPAELTFMAQRAHSQITYTKAGHLSLITQPWVVANVITKAAQAEG
jgi:pimeloyl-ACP methyl ester carboxylesterase